MKKHNKTVEANAVTSPRLSTADVTVEVASPSRTASQKTERAHQPSGQYEDQSLLDEVMHIQTDNIIEIIKVLAFVLFSKDELRDASISGKKSVKSGEVVRPALNQSKLAQLERVVRRRCPSVDRRVFVDKLQNVQKVLRRSAKPTGTQN